VPVHCGKIVGSCFDGPLTDVKALHGCFIINDPTSQLQVGVGNAAVQVFEIDKALRDILWEASSPNNRDRRGWDHSGEHVF
jgi:hypothetical protein